MSTIPRPESTDKMIEQLWFAVIGSNGDGIASTVRRHDQSLKLIGDTIPLLLTKQEHDGCHDHERRAKWRSTDVILTVGMLIVAALSAIGVLI